MRYQVQKYSTTNHEDRVIVASNSNIDNEQDVQRWYAQECEGKQPGEGFQLALVPENHQWFIADSQADEPVAFDLSALNEGEPVSFDEIAKYELARSQAERQAEHEALLRGE